jgi:outer membrane receptor for Fe3+-dicitrate
MAGAEVSLQSQNQSLTVKTGADGRFSFSSVSAFSGMIHATAPGFSPLELPWSASEASDITLTLRPAPVSERIVVSATRTQMKLSEVPGGAVQLSTEDISANPAQNIDDILRQVPGCS